MVMLVQILFLVQLAGAHTHIIVPTTAFPSGGKDEGFTGNITALTVTVQGAGENLTTEAETDSDELVNSRTTPPYGESQSSPMSSEQVRSELRTQQADKYESERTDTSSANDSLKYSSPTPSSNWWTYSDPEQDIGPDSSGELSDDEVDGESAFEPETETSVDSNEELGNDKYRQRLLIVAGVLLPVVVILLIAVVLLMKKFKVVNQKGTYALTAVSPE